MLRRKSVLIVSSLIFSIALGFPANATDVELPEEKLDNIRTNCRDIKQSLKRVQNSDRNIRVSLGQTYQLVMADYITPLNLRLVKNNIPNSDLSSIQSRFASAREAFNRNYITYSQELEALMDIDCSANPQEFYQQLETTRSARATVAETVGILNSIIDEQEQTVTFLRDSLKTNTDLKVEE